MSVIRKIKVKTADPNTFEEKNLGALAENVICHFPVYDTNGEPIEDIVGIPLLSELMNYRSQFQELNSATSSFNTIIDNMYDYINSIKKIIPVYTVLYSNIVRGKYFFKSSTRSIESMNCQLKLYNQYLPTCVINDEDKPYSIHYSILNGTNKIEVFATLQVSFGEVATSRVEEEFTPEENEVYLECIPSLRDIKYFQTDLNADTLTELEDTKIPQKDKLTITQIKAIMIS